MLCTESLLGPWRLLHDMSLRKYLTVAAECRVWCADTSWERYAYLVGKYVIYGRSQEGRIDTIDSGRASNCCTKANSLYIATGIARSGRLPWMGVLIECVVSDWSRVRVILAIVLPRRRGHGILFTCSHCAHC